MSKTLWSFCIRFVFLKLAGLENGRSGNRRRAEFASPPPPRGMRRLPGVEFYGCVAASLAICSTAMYGNIVWISLIESRYFEADLGRYVCRPGGVRISSVCYASILLWSQIGALFIISGVRRWQTMHCFIRGVF